MSLKDVKTDVKIEFRSYSGGFARFAIFIDGKLVRYMDVEVNI